MAVLVRRKSVKAPYCVTASKPLHFIKKPIWKSEKCYCNQKALYCVTVTGVTVSGEACTFNILIELTRPFSVLLFVKSVCPPAPSSSLGSLPPLMAVSRDHLSSKHFVWARSLPEEMEEAVPQSVEEEFPQLHTQ